VGRRDANAVAPGGDARAAVARRFGSEDFRVTMAARHRTAVDERVAAVHAETGARVETMELDAARPVALAAAPPMRAAGQGTIIFTGGGMADNLLPHIATLSLGKVTLPAAAEMLYEELEPEGIRAGTVTIAGAIEAGAPFDPDDIAQLYWDVCAAPVADWRAEYRFDGGVDAGRTAS
jgi:short-subunit dehydrogenase